MSSSDLVTIAVVAAHLGVVPRTVRNYISQGLLTAYRLPGTRGVRLRLNEVDAALRLVPTTVARPATTQFGPRARIVTLPRRVEAYVPEGEA